MPQPRVAGLVLAAGAGRRFGSPKALARTPDGHSWLALAVGALRDAGCLPIYVAVSAALDEVRPLVPAGAEPVLVADPSEGMSASLRAGLQAARRHLDERPGATGAVAVSLVDLPDVDARVVARVLRAVGTDPAALGRAAYAGEPGHPVVIGVDHLVGVLASMRGDRGARDYLRRRDAALVECADLATGRDVDRPVR